MKKLLFLLAMLFYILPSQASEDGKTWPASDKVKQLVKDTIVIDFYAPPFGVGRDKPEQLHTYIGRAMDAGITGGVVARTFTEWMMDGIWPDDITPDQIADMIDYYVNLIGADHVGIATDDMFIPDLVIKFANANPDTYDDEGYMINAFNKGAIGTGELAKILAAVTDVL